MGTFTQAIWWLLLFVDNDLNSMKFRDSCHQTVSRMVWERVLNRYYYLALIVLFFGLSPSCWLGYQLIGATFDENGLLVEVFALIPLAWFFLLLGLITGFYLIWKNGRE